MPWTFSHPAAILPLRCLRERRIPLCALVIGSLSPDFAYYLNQLQWAGLSHSLPGIFIFCLPVGALVLLLLNLSHDALINLLPEPHRSAIAHASPPAAHGENAATTVAAWPWIALGLLLGAASHIAWDSLTHASSAVVKALPILQAPVFQIGARQWHVYHLLQHASSLLGVTALLLVYRRWLAKSLPLLDTSPGKQATAMRRASTASQPNPIRYVLLAASIFAACTIGYLFERHGKPWVLQPQDLNLFRIAVISTNAFALFILASAYGLRMWEQRNTTGKS